MLTDPAPIGPGRFEQDATMSSPAKKTIAQFARSHGMDQQKVGREARRTLGLTPRETRDPHYLLDPAQCARLAEALGIAAEPAEPTPDDAADIAADEPPEFRPDPITPRAALRFEGLARDLYVHPDAFDRVQTEESSRARLSLMLQHLAAHGRTAAIKGCKDEANRGWLRSPFGGNGGKQFYLWWAKRGAPPVKHLDLGDGAVLVRDIRHHDDHRPLGAGRLEDYLHVGPREVEDPDLVTPPWTPAQVDFVEANDPIRFVLGRPGSGKTTVLWKAIEARADQRVLYLTWSAKLSHTADARFRAFAPTGVEVRPMDFVSFLGEICGADVSSITLAQSRQAFTDALARLAAGGPTQWRGREVALHAEMRAFLIGCAVPGRADTQDDFGLCRLTREAYVAARAKVFGRTPAAQVVDAFEGLGRGGALGDVFPELMAARAAIERLRADALPPGFAEFDRVVVDEVQDLTLLDAAVVVELCLAVARTRGSAPWLLIAGDDGQTVRPSGFHWGRLGDLVAGTLGKPAKFHLDENLRCPARIAAVVERMSARYGDLQKRWRPTSQSTRTGGHHTDAHLFHVDGPTVDEAIELLDGLEDTEGVVVLSPTHEPPTWLPERLRDLVLTPADVKGLEYQSVVVLDPGRQMAALEPSDREMGSASFEHAARTSIDQFRVALSRATETLAFVDVDADETERAYSRALLEDAAPYDPIDLVEHFTDADVPVDERVYARMSDARALVEERPRRAWRRAVQAVRLLGDPALPNGVSSPTLRDEAHTTLLATAARLVVATRAGERSAPVVPGNEVLEAAAASLAATGGDRAQRAFDRLVTWLGAPAANAIDLLEDTAALGRDGVWLREALTPVAQALREQVRTSADAIDRAPRFAGDVEAWLDLTGFAGDTAAEARRLRIRAFDALLDADLWDAAEATLARVAPPDDHRAGRLAERRGDHIAAAEAFERAGSPVDALRNWRTAGDWRRALACIDDDGPERRDLGWLADLEALLTARPMRHGERLTPAEATRLRDLLAPVAPVPVAPRRPR